MIFKKFGKTDEKISSIGLGTWKIGENRNNAITSIRIALDFGINFIDTAEMYGTEEVVGAALKAIKRDNFFIATKVSPHHFHYKEVIKACDESIKRLGLKYINLYQLHWPAKNIPIKETMRAMEKLMKDGKIMHIGVSNFSVEEIKEAQSALKNSEIISNQVEYNVLSREIESDGTLEYCKKNNIEVIAYSPFMRGDLSKANFNKVYNKLEVIGKKYNKTAFQVALNWLISKGTLPIPKALNYAHIIENAAATEFKLSDADISAIDKIDTRKKEFIPVKNIMKRTSLFSRIITDRANKF